MRFVLLSGDIPRATGTGLTIGLDAVGAVPAGGSSGWEMPNQRIYGVRRWVLAGLTSFSPIPPLVSPTWGGKLADAIASDWRFEAEVVVTWGRLRKFEGMRHNWSLDPTSDRVTGQSL